MNATKLTNQELFDRYKGGRGDIATEMCRRAGTLKYLLKYGADDRKFDSCMRDTIDVFKSFFVKR